MSANPVPKATTVPTNTSSSVSMRELCNRKLKELQLENLVQDQYAPGVIQDTLDGCENFNAISFDLTLGQNVPETRPQVDPLTLIEAIAMRINYDREQLKRAKERFNVGREKETDPEKIIKTEKKDMEKFFNSRMDTEVNRGIANFLKAENIDKLTSDAKPLFTADINRKENVLPGSELNNYQVLTMITYTATTKPA